MNVIGVKLVGDTKGFVRGMTRAGHAFGNLEYIVGKTAHRLHGKAAKIFAGVGFTATAAIMGGMVAALSSDAIYNGVFKPMLQEAESFQKELFKTAFVAGINIDPNDARFSAMKSRSLKVAMESIFTPGEAAKAFYELMTSGLTYNQAEKALKPLADLVTASFGTMTLEEGSAAMGVALQKMKIPEHIRATGKEAEYLADIFVKLQKISPFKVSEMGAFLDSLGAGSIALELGTEQLLAFYAALRKGGLSNRRAARALNSLVSTVAKWSAALHRDELFTKMGKVQKGAMDKLGLTKGNFEDAKGNLKNVQSIMDDIIKAYADLSKREGSSVAAAALKNLFSGDIGQTMGYIFKGLEVEDAQGRILKGMDAMVYMVDELSNSTGEASKASEIYLRTWEGIKKLIEGSAGAVLALIGDEFIDVISKLAKKLHTLLNKFAEFLQDNPAFRKALAVTITLFFFMAIAAAVLLGVLGTIGIVVVFLAEVFSALGMIFAGTSLGGFFVALLPIMPVLFYWFVALAGVSVLLWRMWKKNLGGSVDYVRKKFAQLQSIIVSLVDIFQDGVWSKKNVVDAKRLGVSDFVISIVTLWRRIKEVFRGIAESLDFNMLDNSITRLIKKFKELGEILFGDGVFGRGAISNYRSAGRHLGYFLNFLIISLAIFVYFFSFMVDLTIVFASVVKWVGNLISRWTALRYAFYTAVVILTIYVFLIGLALVVTSLLAATLLFISFAIMLWTLALVGLFILLMLTPFVLVGIFIWLVITIHGLLVDLVAGFYDLLDSMITWGFDAGKSLISAIADGIVSAKDILVNALTNVLGVASDFLPHSDAKIGPLSTLTHSGRMFTATFASGMLQGRSDLTSTLDELLSFSGASAGSVAGAAAANGAAQGASGLTLSLNIENLNVTSNLEDPKSIAEMTTKIMQELSKKIQDEILRKFH